MPKLSMLTFSVCCLREGMIVVQSEQKSDFLGSKPDSTSYFWCDLVTSHLTLPSKLLFSYL